MKHSVFIFLVMTMTEITADSITDLIHQHGYATETHRIVTNDSYIITTYRIPSKKHSTEVNKHPVLLAHGMFGNSATFLLVDTKSMPYLLADAGYDVWMFNIRGTVNSRAHKYITNRESYWDFSLHELGLYDLGGNIDYVRKVTNKSKIFLLGHSLGCTLYFVLVTTRPEYNDKIQLCQCWSPGVFLWHYYSGVVHAVAKLVDFLWDVAKFTRFYELPPPNSLAVRSFFSRFCYHNEHHVQACLFFIHGFGGELLHYPDRKNMDLILQYFPESVATKVMIHYGQIEMYGVFRQFNYGPEGNMRVYKKISPPVYNISNAVAPIVIFSARGDQLAGHEGVEALSKAVPNLVHFQEVELANFNHNTFIFSEESKEAVYDKVLMFFQRFTPNMTNV